MTRRAMQLSGPVAPPPPKHYGYVDYKMWTMLNARGVHLHVFLDDKDITTKVKSADDETGTVLAYKVDPRGRKQVRVGEDATEVLHGDVLICEAVHKGSCHSFAGKAPPMPL